MPFIEEILNTIQTIICDLQPLQVILTDVRENIVYFVVKYRNL